MPVCVTGRYYMDVRASPYLASGLLLDARYERVSPPKKATKSELRAPLLACWRRDTSLADRRRRPPQA